MRTATVVARNYLAAARVLATSLAAHHDGAPLTVFVLDADDDEAIDGPFDVLRPGDLGFTRAAFHRMAAGYDLLELATAVKPWLLEHLLDRADGPALYLDPDVLVTAPLDDLAATAAARGIVLTPHTIDPIDRDGRMPDERYILRSGVYNLGFLGVGQAARPFLSWWKERLARDCIVDVEEGVFVDQRWVDFVPGLFDVTVVRDPSLNVAYWNVDKRDLAITSDGTFTVGTDGAPLRFFHFSGYDPSTPHLLSKHQGPDPRVLLTEHPALQALCDRYRDLLLDAGHGEAMRVPYRYARATCGLRLTRDIRRAYLHDLVAADEGARPTPPDPFDEADDAAFRAWLVEHPGDGWGPGMTRVAAALFEDRKDLAPLCPDRSDPTNLLAWLHAHGASRTWLPPEFVPAAPRSPSPLPMPTQEGATVAGYLTAEDGVGEGARLLLLALDSAAIPAAVVTVDDTPSRLAHPFEQRPGADGSFDTTIVCVNADRLPAFAARAGHLLEHRYRIGMWAWELEEFPEWMRSSADLVDEIWLGSLHSATAVSAVVDKPVHVLNLPVVAPPDPGIARAELGLPDGPLALFCFSYDSIYERKNPTAVLDAFVRAFPAGGGPTLVLKSAYHERHVAKAEELRRAVRDADRPDVILVESVLDRRQQDALMHACDIYISLHRAEGFGLTMAEAMAIGKPVVATAYSGNLDYMTAHNSWLVPAARSRVPDHCPPYPPGAIWADPDIDAAARALREIWDDPSEAARRGRRAREDIVRRLGPATQARFVAARLDAGRARRHFTGAQAQPAATPMATGDAQAYTLLASGPDITGEGRFGRASHSARRTVSRAIKHFTDYQHTLDASLLQAVRDLEDRAMRDDIALRAELSRLESTRTADLARHDIQLAHVRNRIDELENELRRAARQIDELVDELSAEPYCADPTALRVSVEDGADTIGYDTTEAAPWEETPTLDSLFRGSERLIRERLRPYVELLERHDPVAELGAGRGELLDLLAEARVDASGVDLDPRMVERCREKGHLVTEGDALTWLASMRDGSLGAVVSTQFVEHLAPDALRELLGSAMSKLRPGGLFLAETVNPHSPRALKTFWLDLTHVRPLFPESLVLLAAEMGYEAAHIVFPNGSGKLDIDRYRCGEYALVARTPSSD